MYKRASLAEEAYFQIVNAELRRRLALREHAKESQSSLAAIIAADAALRDPSLTKPS